MQYLINSLTGKLVPQGTAVKCLGVALQTNLLEILHKPYWNI